MAEGTAGGLADGDGGEGELIVTATERSNAEPREMAQCYGRYGIACQVLKRPTPAFPSCCQWLNMPLRIRRVKIFLVADHRPRDVQQLARSGTARHLRWLARGA